MRRFLLFAFSLLLVLSISFQSIAQGIRVQYPKTVKVNHTDTYFGTTITDSYRWLEKDDSPETAKWVEEQNKVTFEYLEKIPYRQKVKERLEKVFNYPKYSSPFRRGDNYIFFKNDGLQNQSVAYIQKGLEGKAEVLLDPNTFSTDGTSRLGAFSISKDGKYLAYGISQGGSDWQTYYVMEIASKKVLPETIEWVKVSGLSWQAGGFYYSRYDAPEKGKELSSKNENHKVYYHKVGTEQSQDELIYQDKDNPQRFHFAATTEDEKFLVLSISDRGKGKRGDALFFRDLSKGEKGFTPIIAEVGDDSFDLIDNVGDKFLIETNRNAPNNKVILFDPKNPDEKNWKEILPEREQPLNSVSSAGGKLFATYLKDVTSRVSVYDLTGKLENEVELPAIGTVGGFGGDREDKFVFYTFTSFTFAPTIYRYDIATKKTTLFRAPEIDFKATDYETKQVFYPSKDGTKVPMFIVHKKGLKLDGNNPVLLYGYGGFSVNLLPGFNPLLIPIFEQGGVYAVANLRGGNEYGEKWHEGGRKLNKQNVFDDFISASEYLIKEKYTSSEKLAIQGGSNGGLLVGAVMNQRPDLFKVAIPQVGVMDMLRFQKFTIGWNWIPEYGSSEQDEANFKNLYAYSPLHNLKETKYPATLVTTADHDDRVVPAHSFKYAATLQEKHQGTNPVLIRVNVKSGHGASSTSKRIEETADIYSFIFYNLGVTPSY
ncbi:MAG: peptidase S9A prolyl oligopeptidase domain protein beta-propeller [bacterium]|nr:MAG: peptidase S9A prolyl oligopeptidase domain protein beta-propeller [bacterium]